jgi:hypothetical protein
VEVLLGDPCTVGVAALAKMQYVSRVDVLSCPQVPVGFKVEEEGFNRRIARSWGRGWGWPRVRWAFGGLEVGLLWER